MFGIKIRRIEKAAVQTFTRQADIYAGLYYGLYQAATENAKNPEKTFREFYKRTGYKAEDPTFKESLSPLLAGERPLSPRQMKKLAKALLKAARRAGITADETGGLLTLTDRSASAYADWDNGELYVDDVVEIIKPAWYQNDRAIETGFCRAAQTDGK